MSASSPSAFPPTLRALLSRQELGLRLALDEAELAPGALDASLRWVHSSNLLDPTPFLTDDLLLLTTGTQFTDGDDLIDAYVARLVGRGVKGLGFGSEVAREGIPPALLTACRAQALPLFEVPYRTPFIALARANAEAIAAKSYARRSWALSAQRAISLAAMRPDGLGATVAELSRQLGAWVGLFDAAGTLMRQHPVGRISPKAGQALANEAGRLIRKGVRASTTIAHEDILITMQTLGQRGHLRGVLAVAGGELDSESRNVVASVIALAELALAQNVGLERAYARLRTGLAQSLLGDDPTLAAQVSAEIWGPLPSAPVVVAVAEVPESSGDSAHKWLAVQASEKPIFSAALDGAVFIVLPADDMATCAELARLFHTAVGVSHATGYEGMSVARAQAETALSRARPGELRSFDTLKETVLEAIRHSNAAVALGRARLAPLHDHDEARGTALLQSLHSWLAHDARIDTAADALGVHRHTLRARLTQAQSLLDADLSSFHVRAELWAAFVATD